MGGRGKGRDTAVEIVSKDNVRKSANEPCAINLIDSSYCRCSVFIAGLEDFERADRLKVE